MRILSITAGAAGMYCGSCLRDNGLAAELIARGHDVTLVPVYTPTLTDEPNVSRSQVLFGGISVYLQQHSSFFRGGPRFIDRILDSPSVINAFAKRSVPTSPKLLGDLTVSTLEGRDGLLAREFDKLVEWMRDEPKPDIINIPNSLLISMARPLAEAAGCPVCCTLQGEELFLQNLVAPYQERALQLIRGQVDRVDRFIAVSEFSARMMAGYLQIPVDRIAVVPLGIDMREYERRGRSAGAAQPASSSRGSKDQFRVGYFARVAPEKGLHLLAEAYQIFRRRQPEPRARLDAAGYLAPEHQSYLSGIRQALERAGLGDEFTYHGAVDLSGKLSFLRTLDVFSMPATYDEPKGISLLEAMASGVPVVQPKRGAFVEVVEKTGGGLLVDADSAESLADGLETLYRDRPLKEQLARRAFQEVRAHYTVQHSVDRLLNVYEDVVRKVA